MVVGTHGSTYGGNPLACAAGQAVLDVVANDEFLDQVTRMGERLRGALEQMIPNHDHLFESVRGLGLMLGVKMKTDSRAFVELSARAGPADRRRRRQCHARAAAADHRGGACHRVRRAALRGGAALRGAAGGLTSAASARKPGHHRRISTPGWLRGDLNRLADVRHIAAMTSPIPTQARRRQSRRGDRLRLPARHARGRLVRLGPVLDEILSAHDYPAPIARILSEALVLTALLGAMLKDAGGQLTLQAQTEAGIVDLLVATIAAASCAAMSASTRERLAELPSQPRPRRPVRQGLSRHHLRPGAVERALSGDRAARGRQPRRGGRALFQPVRADSEPGPARGRRQRPCRRRHPRSSICPRARRGASGSTPGSTIPNGSMSGSSAETIRADELDRSGAAARDPALAAVPRGGGGARARRRCRSPRAAAAISSMSAACSPDSRAEERAEMVDEDGFISVDCEFCSRVFPITLSDLDD